MELYFAPLACSMATRIALYEAGAEAEFIRVDTRTKRVADGSNFFAVNPMGQVPALRTDAGDLLTENQAVLQYVADCHPGARLAPPSGRERYRLQQWLSFIGAELHKAVFIPLLDPKAPEGAKEFARQKAPARFAYLDDHLAGREFVLEGFSVADAYLTAVLNWCPFAGVDLAEWPSVRGYHARMHERPSVARAFSEEKSVYMEEQAHRAAS